MYHLCARYLSPLTEARARDRNLSDEFLPRLRLVSCCRPAALAGRLVPVTPLLAEPPCGPATEACRDGETVDEGGGLCHTIDGNHTHARIHTRQHISLPPHPCSSDICEHRHTMTTTYREALACTEQVRVRDDRGVLFRGVPSRGLVHVGSCNAAAVHARRM